MTAARCLCQNDIGHLCDAHRLELETGKAAPKPCCGGVSIHPLGFVHCCDARWPQPYHAEDVQR